MSGISSRDRMIKSRLIQDTDSIGDTLATDDEILYGEAGTKDMELIAAEAYGIVRALGDKNRRRGNGKIQGSDITLTGNFETIGTAVYGSGTLFLYELFNGALLSDSLGNYREILSIAGSENATLKTAFPSDVTPYTPVIIQKTLAERIHAIDTNSSGQVVIAAGKSIVAGPINVPIAGWLADGTPYYTNRFTGTADPGSLITIPHGVASAYTNSRISNISVQLQDSGAGRFYPIWQYYVSASSIVVQYDNTNIYIQVNGATTANAKYIVGIEYV